MPRVFAGEILDAYLTRPEAESGAPFELDVVGTDRALAWEG